MAIERALSDTGAESAPLRVLSGFLPDVAPEVSSGNTTTQSESCAGESYLSSR